MLLLPLRLVGRTFIVLTSWFLWEKPFWSGSVLKNWYLSKSGENNKMNKNVWNKGNIIFCGMIPKYSQIFWYQRPPQWWMMFIRISRKFFILYKLCQYSMQFKTRTHTHQRTLCKYSLVSWYSWTLRKGSYHRQFPCPPSWNPCCISRSLQFLVPLVGLLVLSSRQRLVSSHNLVMGLAELVKTRHSWIFESKWKNSP